MAAVFVSAACLGWTQRAVYGCSVARDVLERITRDTGVLDLYLVCDGRLVDPEEQLQNGAVYRLEPRLRGGKGGFGSMLRALGAQIEKTTNREACRDLSGRRLRDVNHEKEMAEWLKKQSEREAEKEQRRLERLQKKLSEPKHHFTDSEYQRQCHNLSERLEDSVLKGLQVSSSSQVKAEVSKRQSSEQSEAPEPKKSRSCLWSGLDDLLSSDEDLDQDEEEPVSMATGSRGAGPGPSGRSRSEPLPPESQDRPGPSSSPESQDRPGPSSSPESQDRPGPSSNPGSEDRPGPSSNPGSEDRPGPSSNPGSQDRPGPSSNPGSEDAPGPSSNPGSEDAPGPSSNPGSEDPPGPSSNPGSEDPPGPSSKSAETSSKPEDPEQDSQDQGPLLDLDSVSCPEDLEVLGLSGLKEALSRRGLKCGGTLSERAVRLFSVRGKREEDIDPALLAKNQDRNQNRVKNPNK